MYITTTTQENIRENPEKINKKNLDEQLSYICDALRSPASCFPILSKGLNIDHEYNGPSEDQKLLTKYQKQAICERYNIVLEEN